MKEADLDQVYEIADKNMIRGNYAIVEKFLAQFSGSLGDEESEFYDSALKIKAEERGELEKGVA